MSSVSRMRRRLSAVALSVATVVALLVVPLGSIASAASTACPPGEGPASCGLDISAPDTVVTFQTFTVQVSITTFVGEGVGPTLPSSDLCSPARVTLNVYKSDGEGGWNLPTSYTANASASVATFNISVSDDNYYKLTASAPTTATCSYDSNEAFFTAVFIPQTQPISPCPDNVVCTQVYNGLSTAATLFSDNGMFTDVGFGDATPGMTTACGGGALETKGVLTFNNTTSSGPKTVIFALAPNLVTKGIGLFNVCWSGPRADGTPFTGLLSACGKNATGPCVLFKKSNQKNVGFFGVLAPPGANDPSGYMK